MNEHEAVAGALTRALGTLDDTTAPYAFASYDDCTVAHLYRACGHEDGQAHDSADDLYQVALGMVISASDPDASWVMARPWERARLVGTLTRSIAREMYAIDREGVGSPSDDQCREAARLMVERAIVSLDQLSEEAPGGLPRRPGAGVAGASRA